MNLHSLGLAGGLLAVGLLLANTALADKSVAPRRAEPAKVVIPVQVKHADLAGEGEGVKVKIVLPAKLREAPAGKKVGLNESLAPQQRSLVAAVALSLAAVSVVFVLRGKKLSNTTKGAILGIAALVGAGGIAVANVPPPPNLIPKPVPVAKSTIVIEYSADVEEAILTIGK